MVKYYKSIDELSIFNFNKVIETNDLKYIVKEGVTDNKASIVWDIIMDEYIDYVGLSKSYLDYMRYEKKAALLTCQAYLENKLYLLNFVAIAKQQAQDALGTHKEDFMESVGIVSKYQGYRVNPKEYTVKEFYSIIKLMSNGK